MQSASTNTHRERRRSRIINNKSQMEQKRAALCAERASLTHRDEQRRNQERSIGFERPLQCAVTRRRTIQRQQKIVHGAFSSLYSCVFVERKLKKKTMKTDFLFDLKNESSTLILDIFFRRRFAVARADRLDNWHRDKAVLRSQLDVSRSQSQRGRTHCKVEKKCCVFKP